MKIRTIRGQRVSPRPLDLFVKIRVHSWFKKRLATVSVGATLCRQPRRSAAQTFLFLLRALRALRGERVSWLRPKAALRFVLVESLSTRHGRNNFWTCPAIFVLFLYTKTVYTYHKERNTENHVP